MNNVLATLVGEELEGDHKWGGTLAAPNSSAYGIPYYACRVVKFNTIDKSMTDVGPDFDGECKWYGGACHG